MHEKRTYRNLVKTDDLIKLEVLVKETDLLVRAERALSSKDDRLFDNLNDLLWFIGHLKDF